MSSSWPPRRVEAPLALPCAAVALLIVGALATQAHGWVGSRIVLGVVAVVVALTATLATPAATVLVTVDGWLTAVAFAGPPYAELRGGPLAARAAGVLVIAPAVGTVVGMLARQRCGSGSMLNTMSAKEQQPGRRRGVGELASAVDGRRRRLGGMVAVVGVPAVTGLLTATGGHLSLADDLLVYLLLVVAVSVVGGFWPAVVSAVAASLLLNWFFTPPVHTLTIEAPQNLLALLLFVCAAICVSSVVHLAARRAADAAASSAETGALLELARTVLGGADTPAAVLGQVGEPGRVFARLEEHVGGHWVPVAASGGAVELDYGAERVVLVRDDLRLNLSGDVDSISPRVLDGLAAQAAAALDRERLRTQAAQAEVLGEANRVRTALLTAVSHDLRTPLASIKAAVSSLRQDDVAWSPEDERALLATVEEGTDRLDALIGNLLDMSRIQTGSLQPFLRPTSLDEIVPVALHGIDGGAKVCLELPDELPLVLTDPRLLERAVANLVANSLRFQPADSPVTVAGRQCGDRVAIEVVDHGPGVAKEQRERMFEPFQRLDDRSIGGVGLGLAVARGFIEAMGGAIAAADTPGGGLTMRVELRAVYSGVPVR